MNKLFIISALILSTNLGFTQSLQLDSIRSSEKKQRFKYESLIIPTALITYGIVGLTNKDLQLIDFSFKENVEYGLYKKLRLDDFSQYIPSVAVYGLNVFGVEGKHDFKDRTIILATSYLIMGATVGVLKHTTKVERPDASAFNSFPSGHTATAFLGAEFLWQEYKDKSIWYGIAGYAIATTTGLFRIRNDKHWFSDVVAGAGIGILSTKAAYWLHPIIKRNIFGERTQTDGMLLPYYNGQHYGLAFSMKF